MRLPRAPHGPASSGSGLGEKVVERAVGRSASDLEKLDTDYPESNQCEDIN